jgi:hypothetical protein
MSRRGRVVVALVCLALIGAAGCGDGESGDDPSSVTREGASGSRGGGFDRGGADAAAGKSGSSGQGADSETARDSSHAAKPEANAYQAPPGADDSVQTFGSSVSKDKAAAATSAMRSFLQAVAAVDYRKVCAGLSREAVKQTEEISGEVGNCPAVLAKVMAPQNSIEAEVLAAARGDVYQVRIEEGTAFILFTPRGGKPSFFVMKREGGDWKATGIAPGQELQVAP